MRREDLNKTKWIYGSFVIDEETNTLFLKDRYNDYLHEIESETTLTIHGKFDVKYYKTENVGYLYTDHGRGKITQFTEDIIGIPKEIEQRYREFLLDYVDLELLNDLVSELKRYQVTLYDCVYHAENTYQTNEELSGVHSLLLSSSYGTCYVIHRFIVDEEEGASIRNTFELIDTAGERQILESLENEY